MAQRRHAIEMALDLARMPALARRAVEFPIPPNIVELMRIAAGSPKACDDAATATGEPVQVLVEAARFYLQQLLFRPDADCYRILGLRPGASRATARSHLRWLLEWLHPDRNGDLDAIYTARILKAWREVSALSASAAPEHSRPPSQKSNGASVFRLPWIKYPTNRRPEGIRKFFWWVFAAWVLPSGLVIAFLALFSAVYLYALN